MSDAQESCPEIAGHPTAPCGPGAPGARPGIVATYLHGPVLARNPALADHLLGRVLGRRLPDLDPRYLPDLPALRATYLEPTDPSG